jgi:hypothetical protein
VARPAFRSAGGELATDADRLDRLMLRLAGGGLAITFASALVWLGVQAAIVSGRPFWQALTLDTLGGLLFVTDFGRVWQLRLVLTAVVAALLLLRGRERDDRDWLALRTPPPTSGRPCRITRSRSPTVAGSTQHCAICHGAGGHGDGPGAAGLLRDPADLTAKHTADHTAGDLFWWLTHGIRGTPMPGFRHQPSAMGFRAEAAPLLEGLAAGDAVEFTLDERGKELLVVALRKEGAR